MDISLLPNKGSAPAQFSHAAGRLGGTHGSSQANETGGVGNMTKIATMGSQGGTQGMSLGFSIDLTKLKGKPLGDGQDDNENNGNDYQLDGVAAKPQDFQDEFMAKYDEFSESWRMMLRK